MDVKQQLATGRHQFFLVATQGTAAIKTPRPIDGNEEIMRHL